MVRFSKKLALSSVAAVMLAGGGWMWLQEASAAQIAVGVRVTCKGDKSHLLALNRGPFLTAASVGGIDATTGTTFTDSQGHQVTNLRVDDVYSLGKVEGAGDLAIGMDASRTAPPSSLRSNQRGSAFPATQTMRFFPVIVLNNEVFKSTGAVEVVSSSVQSFPPAPGTTYVLTNALSLTSASGNTIDLQPGKAFTITK